LAVSITDVHTVTFILKGSHVIDMGAHYCPEYCCVVYKQPCPHCGAEDHEDMDL